MAKVVYSFTHHGYGGIAQVVSILAVSGGFRARWEAWYPVGDPSPIRLPPEAPHPVFADPKEAETYARLLAQLLDLKAASETEEDLPAIVAALIVEYGEDLGDLLRGRKL